MTGVKWGDLTCGCRQGVVREPFRGGGTVQMPTMVYCKLHAAAPDLLDTAKEERDALHLVIDWCEEYSEANGTCLFCGPRHADNCPLGTLRLARTNARAAIAKAEGRAA